LVCPLIAAGYIQLITRDAGCWAWDVCAGAIILQECGGFVTGGAEAFENDDPIEKTLFSRRWTCIRSVPDGQVS
jgi:myo-inositol-1(or 4)-monophosphatase